MDTLRLFSDVARLHSFSQAAALHGVTQSAASQRVSALERRLGVTLIDRSVRPLGLTDAGRVFLAGCEDILERYDRLEGKVTAMGGGGVALEGVVRVSAIYSAGIDLLSLVRERFEAAHPGVSVEIGYDQPEHVYRAVLEGACDLGIVSYPETWKRVGIVPLRDEPMAVVCRPDHPLASRKLVSAGELVGYAMATFEADLPVGRRIRDYLREHGALCGSGNGPSVEITSEFDNIDTIKSAVGVTGEFAILPKRTVIREVAARALALVELSPRLVRPIGVIYARGRKHGGRGSLAGEGVVASAGFGPATRAFVEFLVRHAGPGVDLVHEALRGTELAGAER